jgi:hypothetical protein
MFHISHKPSLRPQIAKEYVLPTLKDGHNEESQCVTKHKNNSRDGSKYEHCSPHKI